MSHDLRKLVKKGLENGPVLASSPCRVDFGGTLDLPAMHYPMRHISPCTFNIALDMRTKVRISAWTEGRVKVSSTGFPDADFESGSMPFRHPMGLIFAIAAYFNLDGVHIEIFSASPPRSALGGSSVAAVAIVGAISYLISEKNEKNLASDSFFRRDVCQIAHAIESGTAGVPCGYQDQLAAAFGGVNLWSWTADPSVSPYIKEEIHLNKGSLSGNILVAYCGKPHVSADVNSEWMRRFALGERDPWIRISDLTRGFHKAFSGSDWSSAARLMNEETDIRLAMTPDVLDETGKKLYESAKINCCGARFAGAGGGGCVWAIGSDNDISLLKSEWSGILKSSDGGRLLDTDVDFDGFRID